MAHDSLASPLDRPLPIFGWAMYDFANTIYSAIVVTAFFPLLMGKLLGRDIYTGATLTLSMLLAGLVVPIAGALSDRTGRAKSYLWWLTIACCVATAAIGLVANDSQYDAAAGRTAPALVAVAALGCFALANLTYQVSLVFYNTLLPVVASPARQGRVSGLGVGLGYLGVVFALPIARFAFKQAGDAMWVTFIVAGVAFFLTALPCFFFVHVPKLPARVPVSRRVVGEQFRELGRTLKSLWAMPPILFFFIGNFLCVDAVNTLIMWTVPYLSHKTKGLGWSVAEAINVMMYMSVTAFVLGMGMGWLTDRLGSKRTLLLAAGSMLVCIVVATSTRQKAVILPVILLFGSGGLGGVWAAGRKWLLDVAPPDKVGEFFGLYGLTTKLSVIGCTLFAAIGDWTLSYRIALLSQAVPLSIGIVFLAVASSKRLPEGARRRAGVEL